MKRLIIMFFTTFAGTLLLFSCFDGDSSSSDGSNSGQGGSMARFTIAGNYMYSVDNKNLKLFDLSNPSQPEYLDRKTQPLGFNIETIFSMDTLLFIGSQDGMYIYDITRPEFPQQLSQISHIRSCDPVVASGKYAYVTLNSESSWCGNISNVLEIYDISNLRSPQLISSEILNYPKGLGIDGNRLFVCDAIQGIKVFNVADPYHPVWIDDLTHISEANGMKTYDVIPASGLLLTATDKGLYQFDYKGDKLKFVSKITLNK
ncbi:MAG: hypothetical protein LBH32_03695 [Dysgonamonadaceae bacterium]|jgi:hypothetical protein|nr:hypothetical protein [Dysgonamonadaceae bacterium]